MNNDLDFLVYIGRFSPFHIGHQTVLKQALARTKQLIVMIGSADSPRTFKNPWTAEERMEMIRSTLNADELTRVRFQYLQDRLYQNSEWASLVRSGVRSVVMEYHAGSANTAKIGLVIAEKDSTSWYVNMFPEWQREYIDIFTGLDSDNPIGATKIRELMFTGYTSYFEHIVPPNVYSYIKEYINTDNFRNTKAEYVQGIEYEKLYENHPKGHSINFYTADSVVYQSGHVLLIKRKNSPGKGTWALPGGHVNPSETAEEASLRELMEETNIKVSENVLKLALKESKLFDHPDRSMRARINKKNARTVTVSHFYKLNDGFQLPSVRGGDDAEDAYWFPVETIKNMRNEMFEDHIDQILYFVSKIEK